MIHVKELTDKFHVLVLEMPLLKEVALSSYPLFDTARYFYLTRQDINPRSKNFYKKIPLLRIEALTEAMKLGVIKLDE